MKMDKPFTITCHALTETCHPTGAGHPNAQSSGQNPHRALIFAGIHAEDNKYADYGVMDKQTGKKQ